jgi:hypothetical protein
MSNVLSSLQVVLGADTAAFQRDLGRASESADENFGKIGGAAKTMALALAAAFSVDYIKDNIKKAIDYADAMSDLSGKTGIATEELTAMEYALNLSDATLENYTEGLKKLSVNMVSSIEGNKDLANTFKALGVNVVDAQGNIRQSKDVFLDAAEALSKMQDGAVKTDTAMKLFGKSAGPELIPFLNQGKAGIQALKEEAQQMGAVVSTDMANQSAQFNDSMTKMGYAAKGMWNTIATQLTPSLNGMATSMVKGASDGKVLETTAKGIGIAFHAAFTAISFVVTETQFFGDAVGKVAAVVSTFVSDGAAAAKAVWNDQSGNIEATKQLRAIAAGWTKAGQAATDSAKTQAAAADTVGGAFGGKALGGDGKTKEKKIKTAKAPTLDKSLSLDEIGVLYNEQNAAEIVKLETQREADEAEGERIKSVYDEQNAKEITNNALKLDMKRDFVASFLTMDRARVDGSVTNGDVALEAHKKQQQKTVTFFQNGLDSMAAGHGKAAKAAQAIQKAQALYEIGVNTYRAAMGAYAALSPIPFVGPGLGIAAAAAAIAFGGSMAQGVMKGGGAPSTPSSSGGTPSSSVLTGSNEVVPVSQQKSQTTYIRIPEERMMSGRQLIDFIDDAMSDGKQFNNFRFIPA